MLAGYGVSVGRVGRWAEPGVSSIAREGECIGVVGLGYVGLALACAFGRVFRTVGFDSDSSRIRELREGIDRNGEQSPESVRAPLLEVTDNLDRLRDVSSRYLLPSIGANGQISLRSSALVE